MEMVEDCFYDIDTNIYLNINKYFPKPDLVRILQPYLYLYLLGEYHIYGSEKRRIAKILFRESVNKFVNYNPRFGKKINLTKPKQTGTSEKTFHFNFQLQNNTVLPQISYQNHSEGELSNIQLSPETTNSNSMIIYESNNTSIFNFNSQPEKNNKNNTIYSMDHPKFSMNDIEKLYSKYRLLNP
jgi:hypothetical protein